VLGEPVGVRRQLLFRVALEEVHHVSRELLRGADLDPEGLEAGLVAFLLGCRTRSASF
jgi:hypothetical protein